MTLATLRDYEPLVAGEILADVAATEARDPTLGLTVDSERRAQVIEAQREIRSRLKIALDDVSVEAQTRINSSIFDAIKATVFGGDGENSAIGRLGQSGAVPPHFYEPVISDQFMKQFSGIGVRKSAVEAAIREPDRYEHVWTEALLKPGDAVISLFLKRQPGRGASKGIWLLVQALRRGIQQIAQAAWFVFEDELNLTEDRRVLDVLEEFARKHGLAINLAGKNDLFVREFDLPLDAKGSVFVNLNVKNTDVENFQTFSVQVLEGYARVGVGYAIALPAYRKSLKAHNVIS